MNKFKISGTGTYVPGEAIDNLSLKQLAKIEFDHQKLENKLGIKTRHIAKLQDLPESAADFAERAAQNAIADANIDPKDLGLFIVATDTPEYISPATAIIVQGRIQKTEVNSMAFDINSSCASFTTAFDVASRVLDSNKGMKHAIIIGVYNMPAFIRDGDIFGYTIFADGAGAVIISRTEAEQGLISSEYLADGTQWDFVGVYSGAAKRPITHQILDQGKWGLENLKPLPGDRNVRLWPIIINRLLARENISKKTINHFIFTQINRSVIEKVMAEMELPMEKTSCIMDRYGYTGSACIPMTLDHAIKSKNVKSGDLVLMIASGAGLSVAANLIRL